MQHTVWYKNYFCILNTGKSHLQPLRQWSCDPLPPWNREAVTRFIFIYTFLILAFYLAEKGKKKKESKKAILSSRRKGGETIQTKIYRILKFIAFLSSVQGCRLYRLWTAGLHCGKLYIQSTYGPLMKLLYRECFNFPIKRTSLRQYKI